MMERDEIYRFFPKEGEREKRRQKKRQKRMQVAGRSVFGLAQLIARRPGARKKK